MFTLYVAFMLLDYILRIVFLVYSSQQRNHSR